MNYKDKERLILGIAVVSSVLFTIGAIGYLKLILAPL